MNASIKTDLLQGKTVKITSMGTYLPQQVESADIESRHQIQPGWSRKYSGVDSRHHATTETIGFMGARAAEDALDKGNISIADIDMLISAGGTYDYPLPNQASVIKNELSGGCSYDFPAVDIDSTCLSFVTALDFASKLLDGKYLKHILIVSSEISSKGLDHENWETTTLFGDGAAAAVVSFDASSESLFIKGGQKTYSEGVFDTVIQGGGNVNFFKNVPYDKDLHSFKMNGKKLLRLAKRRIPEFMTGFFEDLSIQIEDADAVIPHQASKMGIHIFENLYKFKEGQVKRTLEKYGNCIAASIPLTLADCIEKGEIKRGDLCMLCGTSAGFSIGAALIRY